jgi:hypothetical protein
MRFLKGGVLAVLLVGVCWTSAAMADTVVDIPGPTGDYYFFGDAALADSWTQDFSVTNGSISVYVQGLDQTGGTIHFYLTTAIGASATLSDLVAVTSLDVPSDPTTETPFSNLNLGPGTYYLIMADYTPNLSSSFDGPAWNYYAGDAGIMTAPGLTLNPMEEASSLGPYAPAASFGIDPYDEHGVMSFTGTIVPTSPTPEPSSVLLIAVTLLAFVTTRIKRSWKIDRTEATATDR